MSWISRNILNFFFIYIYIYTPTAQKMKFSIMDFFSKYAETCRFGQIYWRNPSWKTSFFVQWKLKFVWIHTVWWLYKHLNNETIVDFVFSFFWFIDIEVLCFIFVVEKDENKVLKFDMMYICYFEISGALF